MQHLLFAAAQLGVRVHVAHLDDPEVLGCYDHARAAIFLSMDLTPFEMRSVLAHELGHAYFGDSCSTGANERRAERYAATLLITPDAYAMAEAIDPHPEAIAEELQVTADIVRTYQEQCLQRLGRTTYGRSTRTGLSSAVARRLSI